MMPNGLTERCGPQVASGHRSATSLPLIEAKGLECGIDVLKMNIH